MMDNNEKQDFKYTYCAKDQAELRRIRSKYTAATAAQGSTDKLAELRRIDNAVTGSARAAALTVGITGILTMGFGMSLVMTDLGAAMHLSSTLSMLIGIAVGAIGGIGAGLAYPIYNAALARLRRKAAPRILELTDELMR